MSQMEPSPFVLPAELNYVKHGITKNTDHEYSPTQVILPSGITASHIQYAGQVTNVDLNDTPSGKTFANLEVQQPSLTLNLNVSEDSEIFNKAVKIDTPEYVTFRTSVTADQNEYDGIDTYLKTLTVTSPETAIGLQKRAFDLTLDRINDHREYLQRSSSTQIDSRDDISAETDGHAAAAYLHNTDTLNNLLEDVISVGADIDSQTRAHQ